MASSTRAAPLWSSALLAVLLWAYAKATPSIAMDYCSSINTASMAVSELPLRLGACLDEPRADQPRRPQYLPIRRPLLRLLRKRLCPGHRTRRLVLVLEFCARQRRSSCYQPVQHGLPWLSRRRVRRRRPIRIYAAAESALWHHWHRTVFLDIKLISMYTLCSCLPQQFVSYLVFSLSSLVFSLFSLGFCVWGVSVEPVETDIYF